MPPRRETAKSRKTLAKEFRDEPVTRGRAETSLRGTLYSNEDTISPYPSVRRLRVPGSDCAENHDAQGIPGFNIGDDYMMASYTQLDKYWHKIASECDR